MGMAETGGKSMIRQMIAAGLLLWQGVAFAAAATAGPALGDVPPALLGKDLDGKLVDLAQLRGKVV